MSKEVIIVDRCSVCKTEFPLVDDIDICPYCDGEILHDVPKRKTILKRLLDFRLTFNINPKYKTNKEKQFDIKIGNNKLKKKKSGILFNVSAIRIALIIGIVILAALGKEGWGWLVFILVILND